MSHKKKKKGIIYWKSPNQNSIDSYVEDIFHTKILMHNHNICTDHISTTNTYTHYIKLTFTLFLNKKEIK